MPLVCPAADEPDSSMQVLRDAYYFLQENGYINFGVLKGVQGLGHSFLTGFTLCTCCCSPFSGSCCVV